MSKVTTFLMFPERTKEAVEFYKSVFKEAMKVTAGGDAPGGLGYMANFEIDGQQFHAYEGGPHFQFTEAISLFIACKDQAEVDYYWQALPADGGKEKDCGWVEDRFGVNWQVVPVRMMELLGVPDRKKAGRAVQAMLTMQKLDVKKLEAAAEGKE